MSIAPARLFRDPITDGAADPTVIYNPLLKEWWMFYTQRRANTESPDVAYCFGPLTCDRNAPFDFYLPND